MTSEQLSATATIPATPDEVFAALADPTRHADMGGRTGGTASNKTGWVEAPIDTEAVVAPGQVFRMAMRHPSGDYVTANRSGSSTRPARSAGRPAPRTTTAGSASAAGRGATTSSRAATAPRRCG